MRHSFTTYPVGSEMPFDPFDGKTILMIRQSESGAAYLTGRWDRARKKFAISRTEYRDKDWPTHFARLDLSL